MKKIYTCLAILLFMLFCVANGAKAEENRNEYVKAEIYYYQWDALTRAALTFDDLRERHHIKIVIVSKFQVVDFVKWLKLGDMSMTSGEEEDPRVLIDLYDSSGNKTTYYASRFNLNSADSKMKRKVEEDFFKKFYF